MATVPIPDPAPVWKDEHGDLRIGGSRVLLDLVVHAFEDGATPEMITQRFPSVSLVEVYGAIAFYLSRRDEIAVYLRERDARAEGIRSVIEERQPTMSEIRARLLARRAASGGGDVGTP